MLHVIRDIRQWMSALLLLICTQSTAQTVAEEIKTIPQCSAGIIYALPTGKHQADTPAPDGKKPFYISHFGSTAAYYLEKVSEYDQPINTLAKADSMNMLTPLGKDVLRRLQFIKEDAQDRLGEMTVTGAQQMRELAQEMVDRFPDIFVDSCLVDARSIVRNHCIMSMQEVMTQIARHRAALKLRQKSSHSNDPWIYVIDKELVDERFNAETDAAYKAFNFVVNYSHTKDVTTLLTEPYPGSDDPLLSIIHPVNSKDGYDKLVINPSFRPTIGKWHPLWSAGLIMQNYKTLTASGKGMTLNRPFGQFVWNNDIEIPAQFRLNACLQLRTKGDYDNLRMTKTACNIGMGVQRDFNLKSLGKLTADLRCYDIFNTNKSGVTIYGIRELTSYNPSRRYFSLDITWKFNEAKSKYRGTGAGQEQKARM